MKIPLKYLIITGSLFCVVQAITAQENIYSGEKIPYGVGEMNIPLSLTLSNQIEFGAYSLLNPNLSSSNPQQSFLYANLARIRSFSIGTGIDLHLPLIYLLACKDKSRFRLAEDIGVGCTLGSYSVTRKDYFTGEKLPLSTGKSAVGGSIAFWAGLQAFYRINKTFDIGVKYYPLYLYFGFAPDGGAFITGYGLHARVDKFYADFLFITAGKKADATHPVTYNFKVKYLYGKKRNYLFVNMMYNHTMAPFRRATDAQMTPEIGNINSVPGNWGVYQIGWGILL